MIKYGIAALALALARDRSRTLTATTSVRPMTACASRSAVMHLSNSTTLQSGQHDGRAGHGHQRGKSIRVGQVGHRAQISSHGARRRAKPAVSRLLHARSQRQHHHRATDRVSRCPCCKPGDPPQSQLNLRVLTLTYGYSFWHSEKLEIAGDPRRRAPSISPPRRRSQTEARHVNQTEDRGGSLPDAGHRGHVGGEQAISISTARAQYLNLHFNNLDRFARLLGIRCALSLPAERVVRAGIRPKSKLTSPRPKDSSDSGFFDFNTEGAEFSSGWRSRNSPRRAAGSASKFHAVIRGGRAIPFAGGERLVARRIRREGDATVPAFSKTTVMAPEVR